MTIGTAVRQGTELLARAGVPEPRITAELLVCHAIQRERSYLFAHPEQELREVEWLHYGRWLDERMKGKPLQYITRKQEFYGREFRVSPDVLIPRPETEFLVEAVMKRRPTAGVIIDVGAGSGAIAVTLALELKARVFATDISAAALSVASSNAMRLGAKADFVQTDLLTGIRDNVADVVVSNPPYIPETDRATLQREVRDWEPALALFAGTEGLDIYRRLIPEAWRVLKPGGLLALEMGQGQSDAIAALAEDWRNHELIPDLAGILRVLICEKP